eukprot:6186722-Pleurochrysis_carterae.AAC.1
MHVHARTCTCTHNLTPGADEAPQVMQSRGSPLEKEHLDSLWELMDSDSNGVLNSDELRNSSCIVPPSGRKPIPVVRSDAAVSSQRGM